MRQRYGIAVDGAAQHGAACGERSGIVGLVGLMPSGVEDDADAGIRQFRAQLAVATQQGAVVEVEVAQACMVERLVAQHAGQGLVGDGEGVHLAPVGRYHQCHRP